MSKIATYYPNPFYNGILVFILKNPIPPKQRKGKKQNRNFELLIREKLKSVNSDGKWPIEGKVMVVLSVTGPKAYLANVDIDNVSKTVLDCLKDIVFTNDCNVHSLIAEKNETPEMPGLIIALKKLKENEGAASLFVPSFYGTKDNSFKSKNYEKVWWLTFNEV